MAYFVEVSDELDSQFKKLVKRDRILFEALTKKVQEIRENPHHYKPLRAPLQNKRRVHVGSFVFIFSIDDERNTIRLLEFEHHDKAYK
ncbi:type II toxin-antitoxin system RelE/ParE family toxin [Candidatus Woesearchaeota archaeon]|nr:type II toxin-antitoxin system RelE/ParE family toxin [Candidatus Woesearchaeota archaeon]